MLASHHKWPFNKEERSGEKGEEYVGLKRDYPNTVIITYLYHKILKERK